MKKNIFIGYRTEDTSHAAARLHSELKNIFPGSSFFLDIRDLSPGVDFKRRIKNEIRKADVVLICIGPSWLTAKDAQGGRRLDEPDDYVRFEVETALESERLVVPVLMDAPMPASRDLPDSIKPFAERHAQRCGHKTFERDVAELGALLQRQWQAEPDPEPERRSVWGKAMVAGFVVAALVVGFLAVWQAGERRESETAAKVAAALDAERRTQAEQRKTERLALEEAQKQMQAVSKGLDALHQDAMESIRNIRVDDGARAQSSVSRERRQSRALSDLKLLGLNDFVTEHGIGLSTHSRRSTSNLDDASFARIGKLAREVHELDAMTLVGGGQVSDLSPLRGLRLTQLTLRSFSRVTNLAPLQGMALKTLNLTASSQIESVAPLRGMPLEVLNITNVTALKDLSPLKGMKVKIIGASDAQLATLN